MKPRKPRNTLWKKPNVSNDYVYNVDTIISPDISPPRKRGRKRRKKGKLAQNNSKDVQNPSTSQTVEPLKIDIKKIRNHLHPLPRGRRKSKICNQKKENQNPESEVLDDENDSEDESKVNRSHLHREVKNKKAVPDVVHAFFEYEDYAENKPKKDKEDKPFVPKKPQNVKKKIKKASIPLTEIPEPVAGPSKVIESVFEKSILDILVENRVDVASKKQLKKVLKTVRSWRPESNMNEYRNEPKSSPFYPKNPCSDVDADFTISVNNLGDEYAPCVEGVDLNIHEEILKDNFDNFDNIIAKMKELQICDEEFEALEENEKRLLRDIYVKDEIMIDLLEDSTKALYAKIEAIDFISEWCSKDNGKFSKELKSRCSKKLLPSKRKE